MKNIFFGLYEHNLDSKNRLSIPSKLRSLLTDKVYLMKGFDGCISLYSEENFELFNEKLQNIQFTKEKSRMFLRDIYSSIIDMEIDKVNRIQLSKAIIEEYNIGTKVVVIGSGDHIEIWDKEKYESYNKRREEYTNDSYSFEKIAEEL